MAIRFLLVLVLLSLVAQAAEVHDLVSAGARSLEKLKEVIAKDPYLVFDGDQAKRTPLHCAAQAGARDVVKFLLIKGSNASFKDNDGKTALDIATGAGHTEVVQLLKNHDAALTHREEVEDAVKKNDAAGLKKLLDAYPTLVNASDALLALPIHHATTKEIMEILIERGAVLSFSYMFGPTPLEDAASHGRKDIVSLLIANGVDIQAKNNEGLTALHSAAYGGHKETANLLIEKGAVMDAFAAAALGRLLELQAFLLTDPDTIHDALSGEMSLLHWAALGDSKETVDLLISKGMIPDLLDDLGVTPLDFAAVRGNSKAAAALIAGGADVFGRDEDENTILHRMAASADFSKEGVRSVFELLISKGAKIEAENLDGDTPLHLAAHNGNKSAAEFLISKGADVNAESTDGSTPLALTKPDPAFPGRAAVAELLKTKGAKE